MLSQLRLTVLLAFGLFVVGSDAQFPKRGLPFNSPPQWIQKFNGAGSHINWAYNWDSLMPAGFPGYMEFIPMLWGTAPVHTNQWVNNANNALARGSGHLLAFNEPDNGGQANLSPQKAANAYKQYMMPFAGRASLGSPAITGSSSGLAWLQNFMNLCTGCKIDFVAVHWYDAYNNLAWLQNFVSQAHAITGRQIWITEFHTTTGTLGQQEDFLRQAMAWLDQQAYVSRYSYMMASPTYAPGPFVNSDGSPTGLGNIYCYTA